MSERKERIKMDNTFDSTYVIRKEKYEEFIADAEKLSIASYTIPVAVAPDLYRQIDMDKDIAIKIVWKPETTVAQIKEFDKTWFILKY
jgi:hypothetical protein